MTKLNSSLDPELSDGIIEQLRRKNIHTIVQFINADLEKLAGITQLSLKDILKIKRNILQTFGGSVRNASDLFIKEKDNIVPTYLPSLDHLLHGGLYPGQIYEICGISSSGKTQLCLTIATNVTARSNNLIRYIDTKRDFSGKRIEQILFNQKHKKEAADQILERITVSCVDNMSELFKVLQWLKTALKEEKEDCRTKMIIIDSLPAIIFKFSKDHKVTIALNHLANICHFIANEFHLPIIIVNLITQWNPGSVEGPSIEKCNDITPTLGKYWAHVPNTRLLLRKVDSGKRKILVWKSHQLKENLTCNIAITDCGVVCT